eukprot:gene770-856_t
MAVTSRSLGDSLLGCHPTQAPTTSPPSKTPTLAPTEDSKMTVASASLSSDLLSAIIVSVVGGLLLIVFLFIIMRRLMRKKYVIRRQREQRLQQLPIHRALLSRQIYTNAEFMELLDNHIDTARELDYDENTAIDIVLRSQNRITVSAEAIALLLDDTIPLLPLQNQVLRSSTRDLDLGPLAEGSVTTGLTIRQCKSFEHWALAVQHNSKLVKEAVEIILDKHKDNIEELANAPDDRGRLCKDIAQPDSKRAIFRRLNLHGRYELQSGAPLHESVTSLVIKAVDHGELGWDNDPLDAVSSVEASGHGHVVLKFM